MLYNVKSLTKDHVNFSTCANHGSTIHKKCCTLLGHGSKSHIKVKRCQTLDQHYISPKILSSGVRKQTV